MIDALVVVGGIVFSIFAAFFIGKRKGGADKTQDMVEIDRITAKRTKEKLDEKKSSNSGLDPIERLSGQGRLRD